MAQENSPTVFAITVSSGIKNFGYITINTGTTADQLIQILNRQPNFPKIVHQPCIFCGEMGKYILGDAPLGKMLKNKNIYLVALDDQIIHNIQRQRNNLDSKHS